MAEVFGAVASGIGIAGVAAQAIDGIRKLQAFCNDIRDAPEEIKYLTTELEILLGTIASIEAQIQRNSTMCQNMDPTPALRFVEQSVRSLNAVIKELNAEIMQKRMMGSMRMAWKKKVLESHLTKIERSKTALGLAVSAYSTELYLQTSMRTDAKIDQLSMNVTTQIASYQAPLTAPFGPHPSDSQRIRRNDQFVVDKGDDKDWAGIRKKHKPPKWISVISFTLTVPLWLSQRSLQIDVRRTAQNWTLSLRPYRTISDKADIWKAIESADFDKMRNLIESGQATVFDRDENGHTLLHQIGGWATSLGPETFMRSAHYLIDRGADINEPNNRGGLAIHMFCSLNLFNVRGLLDDNPGDVIFRMLGDEVDLDVYLFWQAFQGPRGRTCSSAIEPELRRRFPLDTLDFPAITVARRLRDTRRFPCTFSPQEVAEYLGMESFEVAYTMSSDDTKRDLLCVALNKWGYSVGERDAASEKWEKTVQGLFALGASFRLLVRIGEKEETPEGTRRGLVEDEAVVEVIRHFVVQYFWSKIDFDLPIVIRDFIDGFEYLISRSEYLGLELGASSPCRRFELCFDYEFMFPDDILDEEDDWWKPYSFSLYYDNKSSTWVMWDSMFEAYCGEFWDLIDHPERMMPGTWVD